MSGLRTALGSAAAVAVLGLGYGAWCVIGGGEERRRELTKSLPEVNPAMKEERRKRAALVMQVLKEAAETNDNITRGIRGPEK